MLDLKFVRANPDAVKADLKRRGMGEKEAQLAKLLTLDKSLVKTSYNSEQLKKKRNTLTETISKAASKKDAKAKIVQAKAVSKKIAVLDAKAEKLRLQARPMLLSLPNLLEKDVPLGKDSSENKVIRRWGKAEVPSFKMQPHGEFLQNAGLVDFERAAKTSGRGFYFLIGELALLDSALVQYSLSHLLKKGFTPIKPPFFMNRAPYEGVTALEDFEKVMYKIEGEDTYLIATSEHPLCAMHAGEILEERSLPLKYAGISPCFRREIGAHGVDTRGLFRVHQFNKVEQFVFCKPEESAKLLDELLKNAEELLQGLRIPYRVVDVCTGDIGTVAARKYDIEAWFPREQNYAEVVSASNCTSYQAVRSNIKFRTAQGKEFVHTLNSTALATSRTIRAIVENFQTEKGTVKIPDALLPFMHGIDEIKPRHGRN